MCACRVIQGFFQGFFYPSTHAVLGKWAPPSERGRLSTYIYAGKIKQCFKINVHNVFEFNKYY